MTPSVAPKLASNAGDHLLESSHHRLARRVLLFNLKPCYYRRTVSGTRSDVLGSGQSQGSKILRGLEIEVGPAEFNAVPQDKGFAHLSRGRAAQCHPSMHPSFRLNDRMPIYRSKGAGDSLPPPFTRNITEEIPRDHGRPPRFILTPA